MTNPESREDWAARAIQLLLEGLSSDDERANVIRRLAQAGNDEDWETDMRVLYAFSRSIRLKSSVAMTTRRGIFIRDAARNMLIGASEFIDMSLADIRHSPRESAK